MKREIEFDELKEILLDVEGVETLLVHLETSEYFKMSEMDVGVFRALRNSVEHTKDKLKEILKETYNF